MRASRYMIFLYAAMIGVPLLLLIYSILTFAGISAEIVYLRILIAAGLIIYCISAAIEVYSHRRAAAAKGVFPVSKGEEHLDSGRSKGREVKFKVARFDPKDGKMKEYIYAVKADRFTTVLDALLKIKSKQDATLSFRYSCRMGVCGSCGMVINGKPSLACETTVFSAAKGAGEISVQPMRAHPLLTGLVTDFDDFFAKHKEVKPTLFRKDETEKLEAKEAYNQDAKETAEYLPYSYCIMCGLCMDACPVVNTNPDFLGPQALSQAYRYHMDSRDEMGDERLTSIDKLTGAWGCEFAGACSRACPKGVDPASAIQLLKADIVKNEAGDIF